MDAPLMARLKKMYAKERLKAEIVKEALEKSGEAISPARDITPDRAAARRKHTRGVCGVRNQRNLLPLPGGVLGGECRDRRSFDPPDP